nr:uncharacterized protein LOC109770203 [Aegilops tauschii subsp. strangulata]
MVDSSSAEEPRVTPKPRARGAAPPAPEHADTPDADADANFRLMVQHVTGVQAEPGAADGVLLPGSSFDASSAAPLLDGPPFDGAFGEALRLPSDVDAAELHRHHQQQPQPCYPTLDSWCVMYESRQLL